MNSINGHIEDIEVSGNLSVVTVTVNNEVALQSIVIETPQTALYLKKGHQVSLLFKETEVILAGPPIEDISIENRFSGQVKHIEKGQLLSKVKLETSVGEIHSIIGTHTLNRLALAKGSNVVALIKMNEIMLSES